LPFTSSDEECSGEKYTFSDYAVTLVTEYIYIYITYKKHIFVPGLAVILHMVRFVQYRENFHGSSAGMTTLLCCNYSL